MSQTITMRNPVTGQTQTFGLWEQTRTRILTGMGWEEVAGQEAEHTGVSEIVPALPEQPQLTFHEGAPSLIGAQDDLTVAPSITVAADRFLKSKGVATFEDLAKADDALLADAGLSTRRIHTLRRWLATRGE